MGGGIYTNTEWRAERGKRRRRGLAKELHAGKKSEKKTKSHLHNFHSSLTLDLHTDHHLLCVAALAFYIDKSLAGSILAQLTMRLETLSSSSAIRMIHWTIRSCWRRTRYDGLDSSAEENNAVNLFLAFALGLTFHLYRSTHSSE